jgi:hypothetical protein
MSMINDAQVFLSGYLAKEPKYRITSSGHAAVTLRVGYTPRRVDRESGEWMDGATSFVTVVCWRTLAQNVATCLLMRSPRGDHGGGLLLCDMDSVLSAPSLLLLAAEERTAIGAAEQKNRALQISA